MQHSFGVGEGSEPKRWKSLSSAPSLENAIRHTIDWRLGIILDFLFMNINWHTVHHAYPWVSYDMLPKVSRTVSERTRVDVRAFSMRTIPSVAGKCLFVGSDLQQLPFKEEFSWIGKNITVSGEKL